MLFFLFTLSECPVVSDLLPIIFSKSRHNIDMFLGEKFDWTREYDELKGASLSLFYICFSVFKFLFLDKEFVFHL